PSVTVGDYVWHDANHNGIQDDNEQGLAGVTLELYGPNGEAVTDVNGNPVETVTTKADGKYSFENLPVLKNGEQYTVKVVDVPEGYKPTKENQGTGSLARFKDSSTGSAQTIPGTLSENGAKDLTLDFGFIKTDAPVNPSMNWLMPLAPLAVLPLIPLLSQQIGGSSAPNPGTPQATAPQTSAPTADKPAQTQKPQKPKNKQLAATGASVLGVLAAALAMIAGGVLVLRSRKEN
ncbi:SdrD B-like domain-containing protein, partial [Corynebacterium diphtheriae]